MEARLKKALRRGDVDVGSVAGDALRDAEKGFPWNKNPAPGACVVLAVVFDGIVGIANVGDARAVAVYENKTTIPTVIHRATTSTEAQRVAKAGGHVNENGRIADGLLEPSRTIGDFEVKRAFPEVSADPAISSLTIDDSLRGLVLATDGVCDSLDVATISRTVLVSQEEETAKSLVDLARAAGSTDDATAVVLDFLSQQNGSMCCASPVRT